MRQNAAPEHDNIGPNEAVFADLDRFRRLPARGEIDAVGEELRAETADGGESADVHPRRAIDQVPARDAGVGFDDQFRAPLGLMSKVPAGAAGKSGNPI